MKGKKTCIMTTDEHYTLLCVYCFAGKHHSCCAKCCLSHDCTQLEPRGTTYAQFVSYVLTI